MSGASLQLLSWNDARGADRDGTCCVAVAGLAADLFFCRHGACGRESRGSSALSLRFWEWVDGKDS